MLAGCFINTRWTIGQYYWTFRASKMASRSSLE